MRENLLGYLLNAVEPEERATIEQHLAHDEKLRTELDLLRRGLHPLSVDTQHHQPPVGLAQRCCDYVFNCAAVMPAQLSMGDATLRASRRWSWLDISVASAIAVAVAVLLLPAIYQSRIQSQILACQNNLKDLAFGAFDYSDKHGGYYPAMQPGDKLNTVGMWGPVLNENGYLPVANTEVCPSSSLAEDNGFSIPRVATLRHLSQAQYDALASRLGGSYAMALGQIQNGTYKPQKHSNRNFPVMADRPGPSGTDSLNHGGHSLNVLYDQGNIRHQTSPEAGMDRNIYANDNGEVAPGTSPSDAVLAPSEVHIVWPR